MKSASYGVILLNAVVLFFIGLGLIVFGLGDVKHPVSILRVSLISTLGAGLVVTSVLWPLLLWMRRSNVDWIVCALFLLWVVVSLYFFYRSPTNTYTNDIDGHISRAMFISKNWLQPYGFKGLQEHHPPLYYYMAAVALRVSEILHSIHHKTILRFLSWVGYAIFLVYGLRTIMIAQLSRRGIIIAAALLTLWPGGVHFATKINSESWYYAAYAAMFFYAVKWYQEGDKKLLANAFIALGIATLIRTNAAFGFLVLGVLLIVAYFRKKIVIRDLFNLNIFSSLFFLAACVIANLGKLLILNYSARKHLFGVYRAPEPFDLSRLLGFNLDMTFRQPFNNWKWEQTYWDYLVKTSMFGEYRWPSPTQALWLDLLLMLIIIYTILPWCVAKRIQWRGMMPHACNVVLPVLGLLPGLYIMRTLTAQDARYIFPALVSFVIFTAKSQTMYREQKLTPWMDHVGSILVAVFLVLSIGYFSNNFR